MRDAFDEYKVFVYDPFTSSNQNTNKYGLSRLPGTRSLSNLHIFQTTNKFQRLNSKNSNQIEDEKYEIDQKHRLDKALNFDNLDLKDELRYQQKEDSKGENNTEKGESSPASESTSLITDELLRSALLRQGNSLNTEFDKFFPKINPDFLKFIQTLLLSDEVTLLKIKPPKEESQQSKELLSSIELINSIKKMISSGNNYKEEEVMPLLKRFILEIQAHFQSNEGATTEYLNQVERLSKQIAGKSTFKSTQTPPMAERRVITSKSSVESLVELNNYNTAVTHKLRNKARVKYRGGE